MLLLYDLLAESSTRRCISAIASFRLLVRLRHSDLATVPVGKWVIRHEFWCLFLYCPPAPVPLYHSIFKSFNGIDTDPISVLRSMTATVTVLVCTLPLRSVGGTRCILCPPGSLSKPDKSTPSTSKLHSPRRTSIRRVVQPSFVPNLL